MGIKYHDGRRTCGLTLEVVHLFFDFFLRIFPHELTEVCHLKQRHYFMIKHKLKQNDSFRKKSITLNKLYPRAQLYTYPTHGYHYCF